MMSDDEPTAVQDKPFPWFCSECRQRQIFPLATNYTIAVRHDGQLHQVRIPDLEIPTCRNCGERVFSGPEDDRITAALREQVGLLTPEDIRKSREQRHLSQDELAVQIGVTMETIERWEAGYEIQSCAMDNLLRLYFGSEEARALLKRQVRPAAAARGVRLPSASASPVEAIP